MRKNSEFIFVYYGETINPNRKVSIKVTNQPIRPVLDKLFKGMSVEYTIDNRQITLKKVAQKKVQPQSSKRKTIQGFVLDKDEQPITGATIKIKDSTTGALTDIEGFYKLELEEENPVLIVSFMGYITQEVKVGKKSILNIQLEEDTKALDEVVVTAFGIGQKKGKSCRSYPTDTPGTAKSAFLTFIFFFCGTFIRSYRRTTKWRTGSRRRQFLDSWCFYIQWRN